MKDILASLFELAKLENLSVKSDKQSTLIEGSLRGLSFCPWCGGSHLHRQTKRSRLLHLPPVGSKATKLQVNIQKQYCVDCKHRWWPSLPFTNGQARMSHSFVNYALDLLRFGTIKDVSQHLGVSWDVVKDIHKKFLAKQYERIDVSTAEYVSIDEFSIAKRHKYMSTIMDIKTGRILYAIEGRKKKDIASSLKELKKKHPSSQLLRWI